MRRILGLTLGLALGGAGTADAAATAASLRGSPAAMVQQNRVAQEHELTFYRTPAEIHAAVAAGDLVELTGDENYAVADFVRFPFVQPAALLFVERLSAQYRDACGQKLVVTSAVRPSNGQPSNAHRLSVHPAGMALDLRVSDRAACRSWLEGTLLSLERRGVLNGIREFHPPHYHVAVFPKQYLAYAHERMAAETELAAEQAARADAEAAARAAAEPVRTAMPSIGSGFVDGARSDDPDQQQKRPPVVLALLAVVAVPVGLGALARKHLRK
jgi:hypothetical protein